MPSMLKVALPALAAASTAYAACSTSGTMTIQNSGDATALASCSTYSGSIAIATGTTDDIALNGVERLNGNLVAENNDAIRRISADSMETLDGEMNLDGLTGLYAVEFPKLKTVDSIKWNALPKLAEIGFTAEVEKAEKISIQNTALESLRGINVQTVDTLFIANNGRIDEISMQLGNVSTSLDLSFNNEEVKVSLPNLVWAYNLTFRFCGSVEVPSLEALNGSLGLYNNGFESFSAPNLTTVGDALAFVANENLSNMTFPKLTEVTGSVQIANNSALETIDGFPELETVGASLDLSGNMSSVETPKLDSVVGTFNLQSTENVTEACGFYKPLKDKKKIEGDYYCRGRVEDPGQEGHRPKSQTGNDESSAVKTLSAVNGALGLAAMAAVLLF